MQPVDLSRAGAAGLLEGLRGTADLQFAEHQGLVRLHEALVSMSLGEPAAARSTFLELAKGAGLPGQNQGNTARLLGLSCLHLGLASEARRWLDAAKSIFESGHMRAEVHIVDVDLATLALLEGDLGTASRLAAAAAAELEKSGMYGHLALARIVEARASPSRRVQACT